MATRKRTRARELALQHLYSVDLLKDGDPPEVEPFLRIQTRDDAIYLFATGLVHGTLAHLPPIDAEIQRVAANWEFHRMAVIDRNILRLGTYELLYRNDIPPQVTLNEWIELAKRFSTRKSGAFVNGVLDRIREEKGRTPDHVAPLELDPPPAREPEGETREALPDEADDEAGDGADDGSTERDPN